MANILAVGIATIDIINRTKAFPHEDEEVRAISQDIKRGGNATNTLVVLSQLGNQCQWLGCLANDDASKRILEDLDKYNIDHNACEIIADGTTPTSYITLNQQNGSRTIVHYRNLPELSSKNFDKIQTTSLDWIHFEGRNVTETQKMLSRLKKEKSTIPVSIEIEKHREDLEALFCSADTYFFSRAYAKSEKFYDAEEFLRQYRTLIPDALLICTWGSDGAYALEGQKLFFSAAPILPTIVDTIGAGDTFIAAFIHAATEGKSLQNCLDFACKIAAKKCTQNGFDFLK